MNMCAHSSLQGTPFGFGYVGNAAHSRLFGVATKKLCFAPPTNVIGEDLNLTADGSVGEPTLHAASARPAG
jgi:hypothetical protein